MDRGEPHPTGTKTKLQRSATGHQRYGKSSKALMKDWKYPAQAGGWLFRWLGVYMKFEALLVGSCHTSLEGAQLCGVGILSPK